MKTLKVGAIVQARMGSTRLPGKVMADLGGKPALLRVLERAKQIKGVDKVMLATTTNPEDEVLIETAMRNKVSVYAGSEKDVLHRYYRAADFARLDVIVRITADCPLLDPAISSHVVSTFLGGSFDYVSNCHPPTYPDGLDTEVFSFKALRKAWLKARTEFEREHVTPHIWRRPYKFHLHNVETRHSLAEHRWTLDTQEDLEFIRSVYETLGEHATPRDILSSGLVRLYPRIDVL